MNLNVAILLQWRSVRGGAIMVPSLRAFVANEMGREAAVLKEKRKTRDARQQVPHPKGGGGGKP